MEDKKYLIDSCKDFILKYPLIDNMSDFGVDFLSNDPNTYSIEEVPIETTIEEYIDGSSKRQFVFVFASRFNYSQDIENNKKNSHFYEDFSEWIEQNSKQGNLPDLNNGKVAIELNVLTGGYLYSADYSTARWQMQLQLIYEQEE